MIKQLGFGFDPGPKASPRRAITDPNPRAPRPFIGAPIECTEPRRCSVCGNVLEVGRIMLVYQGMAAHVGCGQVQQMAKRIP